MLPEKSNYANQENETGEKTLNTKLELNAVPDDGYRFLPYTFRV